MGKPIYFLKFEIFPVPIFFLTLHGLVMSEMPLVWRNLPSILRNKFSKMQFFDISKIYSTKLREDFPKLKAFLISLPYVVLEKK